MSKKISYISILCISLITISGCKICIIGKKTEYVHTIYGKTYWKAVDSKKSKYIQDYTKACNKEAEDAKNQVDAIFLQICSKGHIPKEYLPQAQIIQNDYLKYHYNEYYEKDPNVKDILRIGTIDEIYKRFITGSYDKTPSNERMVKACALYIPKNGILYDYGLNYAFGPSGTYKKFYFERCMTNFNLIKITPVTTKKEKICRFP